MADSAQTERRARPRTAAEGRNGEGTPDWQIAHAQLEITVGHWVNGLQEQLTELKDWRRAVEPMMADQVRILGEIRDSINQRMPTLDETRALRERSENLRAAGRAFNFTRSVGVWVLGMAALWAWLTGQLDKYIRGVNTQPPQQQQSTDSKK